MTRTRHLSRSIALGVSCLVLGFVAGSAVKDRMVWSPRLPVPGPVSTDGRTDPVAFARSNALVDEALEKRVWNTAQAEEFHPLMLQLSALDRDTVMRRLFVAVNAGRVAMRATGLPF